MKSTRVVCDDGQGRSMQKTCLLLHTGDRLVPCGWLSKPPYFKVLDLFRPRTRLSVGIPCRTSTVHRRIRRCQSLAQRPSQAITGHTVFVPGTDDVRQGWLPCPNHRGLVLSKHGVVVRPCRALYIHIPSVELRCDFHLYGIAAPKKALASLSSIG